MRPAEVRPARSAVKICGVTRAADAELAARLGADFIGLNFWPGSPRALSVAAAREVAAAVRGRVALVGVFVNPSPDDVARCEAEVGLDYVQFSGDESAAQVALYRGRAIKAFRAGAGAAELVAPFSEAWAWLFDATHPTLYGGTGATWDVSPLPIAGWQAVGHRVFLAGGLGPGTVGAVLARFHPDGLDVCSRVESSPGIKDGALLRQLFEEIEDVQAQALP
jgi:phosphoribosylanthranilate isomerase